MLKDSPVEVVSHADVERPARAALHDVNVVAMFARHEPPTNLSSRAEHWFREAKPVRSRGTLCFFAQLCAVAERYICDEYHRAV